MPDLLKAVEKVDDHTVKFIAEPSRRRRSSPTWAWTSPPILSAEYADKMMAAGTPEKVDLDPVGTGPFQLVAYQKDAVIRYKAHPGLLGGKAAIDNLIFAITPGRLGALSEAARPASATSCPIRTRPTWRP